jgi:tripartite-type tricarboxylate transporter receptor subunit TctC
MMRRLFSHHPRESGDPVRRQWILAFAGMTMLSGIITPAWAADDVAGFYKGRTVTLDIGYSAGGGYDIYARVLARHLGDHIPGNPDVVPQNMPGAGSLKVVNYLYAVAPKDGTVIATFARGLAMQPLFDKTGVEFDAQKLNWIGSITNEVSVCAFRSDSGVKTWQDMLTKAYTVGGTGSGSDTDVFPVVLHNMFHMQMKLAMGYPGGEDVVLALQRGEVSGRCGWSWSSLKSRNYTLYQNKDIVVPVQLSLNKHPDLPDVPLIMDLTKDPQQAAALKLIFGRQSMARPYAAPPDLPPERVAALRKAFDDTMKDPAFLEETQKTDLEVQPVSGAAVQALVADIYRSSPDVVKIAADATKSND